MAVYPLPDQLALPASTESDSAARLLELLGDEPEQARVNPAKPDVSPAPPAQELSSSAPCPVRPSPIAPVQLYQETGRNDAIMRGRVIDLRA
jgi:hypothetical protein